MTITLIISRFICYYLFNSHVSCVWVCVAVFSFLDLDSNWSCFVISARHIVIVILLFGISRVTVFHFVDVFLIVVCRYVSFPSMFHVKIVSSCAGDMYSQALQKRWNVGLSTGGVAEVFETTSENETIVIKDRKGFVREALKSGTHLMPCYIFGNTKVLTCLVDPFGMYVIM